MRIGIFLEDFDNKNLIEALRDNLKEELVGYTSAYPNLSILDGVKFEPYPLELLSGCDVALVFDKSGYFESIPKAAIRRGIHLYLHFLESYSINQLQELKGLMQEIKMAVGFGFSGFDVKCKLSDLSVLQSPFLMEYRMEMDESTTDNHFSEQLHCDIATIIRFNPDAFRKIRSVSFPNTSTNYNLLNLRFEYSNGSVINYTLSRLSPQGFASIKLYGNQFDKQICLEWNVNSPLSYKNISLAATDQFLYDLRTTSPLDFSVDQAIEVNRIVQELDTKSRINSSF